MERLLQPRDDILSGKKMGGSTAGFELHHPFKAELSRGELSASGGKHAIGQLQGEFIRFKRTDTTRVPRRQYRRTVACAQSARVDPFRVPGSFNPKWTAGDC